MFCSKCGKEMADGNKFCPECGTGSENIQIPVENKKKNPLSGCLCCLGVIVIGFILLAIIGAIGSNDAINSTSNPEMVQVQSENNAKPKISFEFKNALAQAKIYSETMYMSKKAIYSQLTSEYGGNFPADAAQYAVDNLKADFRVNALAQAKTYQSEMNMSKKAVYNQLISEFGGKFTVTEAQYAIDHLND